MQMMSLVKGGESTSLGLTMLLTASEELATPREDIATTRSILVFTFDGLPANRLRGHKIISGPWSCAV